MVLAIESVILCVVFSAIVLTTFYRNPVAQIMSYPAAIRKRVETLPEYQSFIKKNETTHLTLKILSIGVFALLLAVISYLSGAKTFERAFFHTFFLFFIVNVYDALVLDLGIFCHSKRAILPGTEDMVKEYKSPWHHLIGAGKGILLGAIVGVLAGLLVAWYGMW